MYNGIGLKTVRGTATSGYVQRNLGANQTFEGRAQRRQRLAYEENESKARFDRTNIATRKVDPKIVEHEKKRAIEVKCMELRVKLEENNASLQDIDKQVTQLRNELKSADSLSSRSATNEYTRNDTTYNRTLAKQRENERLDAPLPNTHRIRDRNHDQHHKSDRRSRDHNSNSDRGSYDNQYNRYNSRQRETVPYSSTAEFEAYRETHAPQFAEFPNDFDYRIALKDGELQGRRHDKRAVQKY